MAAYQLGDRYGRRPKEDWQRPQADFAIGRLRGPRLDEKLGVLGEGVARSSIEGRQQRGKGARISQKDVRVVDHIRHLAIYVDEPDHGCFHWVIIESTEDASVWTDIESSEESFDMWLDAYSAGNGALMKLVEDERVGPRAAGEDEDSAPVG